MGAMVIGSMDREMELRIGMAACKDNWGNWKLSAGKRELAN